MTTQDMDRVCTTIVIIAAVVLLCMGFSEMSKMRSNNSLTRSHSTCGMKSNQIKNDGATSAKAAFLENKTNKKDTAYMTSSEEWPNEKVECKHKELIQDPVLNENYSWEASEEVNSQYDKAKVSHDKAKASANIRSIDVQTMARSTLGTKNLGTPGFMAAVRESTGRNGAAEVKFADSCVDFLQSEAYSQARQEVKKSCNRF